MAGHEVAGAAHGAPAVDRPAVDDGDAPSPLGEFEGARQPDDPCSDHEHVGVTIRRLAAGWMSGQWVAAGGDESQPKSAAVGRAASAIRAADSGVTRHRSASAG